MSEPFDKEQFYADLIANRVIEASDPECTEELLKCADEIWDSNKGDEKLRAKSKPTAANGRVYSDRWDDNGRQVVDLVQEGGGMLGISLVGYTYILEKAGLRFMSLAGTSAGGINTMMLAAIPDSVYKTNLQSTGAKTTRQPSKSEILAHIIANTEFKRFIDRKGMISTILSKLIQRWWKVYAGIILFLFGPVLSVLTYVGFSYIFTVPPLNFVEWKAFSYLTCFFSILFPFVILYLIMMVVLGKNFGINPGTEFKDWVNKILTICHITDTDMLMKNNMSPLVLIKPDNTEDHGTDDKGNKRRLVLLSSNVTFNRIVKFPERGQDYWDNPERVFPAEYVRATMSIPFFFDVYIPESHNGAVVTKKSRFVDGGMLSNFPIREFHSPRVPRFPTFGIKLGLEEANSFQDKQTLLDYIYSFFNTFKEFYDNEFLNEDPDTSKLIATIDTLKANWLNFWMTNDEKKELFCQGAKAACLFLDKFDWGAYKNIRSGAAGAGQSLQPQSNTVLPSTTPPGAGTASFIPHP